MPKVIAIPESAKDNIEALQIKFNSAIATAVAADRNKDIAKMTLFNAIDEALPAHAHEQYKIDIDKMEITIQEKQCRPSMMDILGNMG